MKAKIFCFVSETWLFNQYNKIFYYSIFIKNIFWSNKFIYT